VKLCPPLSDRADQIGVLEHGEVLSDSLPTHVEAVAQLTERLTVGYEQAVQEKPSCGIGQCFEGCIHPVVHNFTICKHLLACQRLGVPGFESWDR
jgi:hypothetical protein